MICVCVTVFFSACKTNEAAVKTQINSLEQRRTRAMIAADTAALAPCLAQDLRFVHTHGLMENKQEFIDAIAFGKYKFSHYAMDSLVWRIDRRLTVVHGSAHIVVFAYEKEYDIKTRYTAAYTRKRKSGWQLAGWQNTKI